MLCKIVRHSGFLIVNPDIHTRDDDGIEDDQHDDAPIGEAGHKVHITYLVSVQKYLTIIQTNGHLVKA